MFRKIKNIIIAPSIIIFITVVFALANAIGLVTIPGWLFWIPLGVVGLYLLFAGVIIIINAVILSIIGRAIFK